jgi:hypothetical protein
MKLRPFLEPDAVIQQAWHKMNRGIYPRKELKALSELCVVDTAVFTRAKQILADRYETQRNLRLSKSIDIVKDAMSGCSYEKAMALKHLLDFIAQCEWPAPKRRKR